MRMIAPDTGAPEITVAEEQEEYMTLTAAVYEFADGAQGLLTRWRPTDEELRKLIAGEDLYLLQLTFGKPMQPIKLQVGPEGYVVEEEGGG